MAPRLRVVASQGTVEWTDEDIRTLASTDRTGAMALLIERYRDRLFFHASRIVKDGQEAYDVVQEVFLRAMREPRLFDPEFKAKAWLFRVTTNRCFNTVRNRNRRGTLLEGMRWTEAPGEEMFSGVFEQQRRDDVLAAIDRMGEEHKEILLLRYYDDLSYAEIADVLEIKLGTVMSRLSRARVRLLEALGPAHARLLQQA
jgi:RNA polymerase sigma-70 factor (ECF subfamily)